MYHLIFIPIMIAAIWYPREAALIYIIIIFIIEGYKLFPHFFGSINRFNESKWNSIENAYLKKYYVFFLLPVSSRKSSSMHSFIALSAILWVPWLIYNGLYFFAAIIGLNYFLAQYISLKLNPIQYFVNLIGNEMKKGEYSESGLKAQRDLVRVKHMLDKMYVHTSHSLSGMKALEESAEYKLALIDNSDILQETDDEDIIDEIVNDMDEDVRQIKEVLDSKNRKQMVDELRDISEDKLNELLETMDEDDSRQLKAAFDRGGSEELVDELENIAQREIKISEENGDKLSELHDDMKNFKRES